MGIKTLYTAEGLEAARDQLIYTEGRMLADEDAKDLAPIFTTLVGEVEKIILGLWALWREETLAQGLVDGINYRSDRRIEKHRKAADRAADDHPEGKALVDRYYNGQPVSKVVALSLEPQVKLIRTWMSAMISEASEELRGMAPGFQSDIDDGESALRRREQAASKRKDYWLQVIAKIIREINDARAKTHATLVTRGIDLRKPRAWADEFYKKQKRNTPKPESPETAARAAVLSVFPVLGFELTDKLNERIQEEQDLATLKNWLKLLVNSVSLQEIFGEAANPDE